MIFPVRTSGALAVLILTAAPLSYAQRAAPSLDSLLAAGQVYSPELRVLMVQARMQHLRPSQIAARPDPMIEAVWQPLPVETAQGPIRSQWMLMQRLPWHGARALQRRMAEQEATMADLEAFAFALQLSLNIKRAYFELYRIQELETLVIQHEQRLERFIEVSQARYTVGSGSQADLLHVQLEKNTLQHTRLQLRAAREIHLQTLVRYCRIADLERLAGLVRVSPPTDFPMDADRLMGVALQHHPDLASVAAQLEQSKMGTALAHKAYWPDLAAGLTWTDIRPGTGMGRGRDALGIRLSVSVPLSRSVLQAGVEAARLRESAAHARHDAILTGLQTTIATQVAQLREAYDTIELYEEGLIPQSEVTLETTLAAYAAGQASFQDHMDAERAHYAIDTALINAQVSLLLTVAELEHTLGIDSIDAVTF